LGQFVFLVGWGLKMLANEETIKHNLIKNCGHRNTVLIQTWTAVKAIPDEAVGEIEIKYQCSDCCEKQGVDFSDPQSKDYPFQCASYPITIEMGE